MQILPGQVWGKRITSSIYKLCVIIHYEEATHTWLCAKYGVHNEMDVYPAEGSHTYDYFKGMTYMGTVLDFVKINNSETTIEPTSPIRKLLI